LRAKTVIASGSRNAISAPATTALRAPGTESHGRGLFFQYQVGADCWFCQLKRIFHEIPSAFFVITPFISMGFTLFRQIIPRGYA